MRLVATDAKSNATATYDVLELDFGVDAPSAIGTATGGASASKPVLRPLEVVVRPNPSSALLAQDLTGAVHLSKLVLQRVAADGTATDLAQLDKPVVTRMLTAAGADTRESYEIQTATLTLKEKGASVTIDLVAGKTTCTAAGGCPCVANNPGQLGPYTQSGPLGVVAKGNTRVDHLGVELHNEVVATSGTSALTSSKAVLDGISFDAALETSGLCAMYYAGTGIHVTDVHLGVAAPTQAKGTPNESTTWDACLATVVGIGFSSSSATEPVREHVKLGAAGLVRTDRTFDPITGVQTGKDLVTGWSFAKNAPIASCSEAIPGIL